MTHSRDPALSYSGKLSDKTVVGTVECPTCSLQLSSTTRYCPNDSTPLSNNEQERAIVNYQILRLLGSGGMGDVYEAEHVVLKQRVAIKTLKSHLVETSAFMRFQSEALAAGQLKHPNIVSVYDCGLSANGEPYMIMEMVTGASLGQLIASSGSLGLDESLDIISQICKAIDFAHEKGILHRDLKPSNIMLEVEGSNITARILDFGIAKIMESEDPKLNLTRTGELIGTPSYMSPEQAQGGAVDRRSDIYSIGCMLFEMLTGQPPFLGRSAMDVMMKHISEAPLSLSEAALKPFPGAIELLVARSLAKSPAARFASAREMDTAIRNYRKGLAEPVLDKEASKQKPKFSNKVLLISSFSFGAIAVLIGLIFWSLPSEEHAKSTPAPSADVIKTSAVPADVAKSDSVERQQSATETDNTTVRGILSEEQYQETIKVPSDYNDVTDVGLGNLRLCKKLKTLDLSECDLIKCESQVPLNECPELTSLILKNCKHLTLSGLTNIAKLPKVTSLNLAGTELGDDVLNAVKNMHLWSLNLSHTKISDKSLLAMKPDFDLVNLVLKDCKNISDKGLPPVAKLKKIRTLSLDSCRQITDTGIETLSNSKLRSLSLAGCRAITAGVVPSLLKMQELETLYLMETGIDKAALLKLAKNERLKVLNVSGCPLLTKQDVDDVRGQTHCKIQFLPTAIEK